MRIQLAVLTLGFLAACGPGNNVDYAGTQMVPLFPFDGTRTWDFISTDTEVSYKLVAQMRSTEPDDVDGVNVYPVDYVVDCVQNDTECVEGELVRSISWASDLVDGVFIYEWTEGTNAPVVFDPPLLVAEVEMKRGEGLSTDTAGATWTSTLSGFEPCPVRMNVDWDACARITLDDGDDNPETGRGLAGDYWAIRGFNVVGIQLEGAEDMWELSKHVCEPDEDCDGVW